MFWPGVAAENFAVRNAARWCVMGGEFCLTYCCPCQYVNSANGGISGISGMDVFQSRPWCWLMAKAGDGRWRPWILSGSLETRDHQIRWDSMMRLGNYSSLKRSLKHLTAKVLCLSPNVHPQLKRHRLGLDVGSSLFPAVLLSQDAKCKLPMRLLWTRA